MFLTAVIDAVESCDVDCFDIAFLHADCDKDITMVLKGRLAELMVQVAPNLYRKYITVDQKNMAVLYVKMQKALYCLLRSTLLFIGASSVTSNTMASSSTHMTLALQTKQLGGAR